MNTPITRDEFLHILNHPVTTKKPKDFYSIEMLYRIILNAVDILDMHIQQND